MTLKKSKKITGSSDTGTIGRAAEQSAPAYDLRGSAAPADAELEADRLGAEISIRAGYSFAGVTELLQGLGAIGHYSSLEGLAFDHPSWTARLEAIDRDHIEYWRAMSAFGDKPGMRRERQQAQGQFNR